MTVALQRVAVAGLREAPDEDLVASVEEEHLRLDAAALEGAAWPRRRRRCVAGPDIQHDRDLREALGVGRDELGHLRQQLAGQVVDAR